MRNLEIAVQPCWFRFPIYIAEFVNWAVEQYVTRDMH